MAKRFPKQIVVTREPQPNDDPYLRVIDGVADVEQTTPCAVYQLVRVSKIEVTRTLK